MAVLSGLLQDVWIKDPVSNQALFWDGVNWVNQTLPSFLTSVNTDGVTIQGDSVTAPVSLKAVKTDGVTVMGNGNVVPLSVPFPAIHSDGTSIGGNGSPVSPFTWMGSSSILTAGAQTSNATATTLFRIQTSVVSGKGSVYHFKYHIVAASPSNRPAGGNATFTNEVCYSTVSGSLAFVGRGTQLVLPSATSWTCTDTVGASNQIDINVAGSSGYFVYWSGWVDLYVQTIP